MAVLTLAVEVPEEDVVGKQDGVGCNPDVGVPEEEILENKMARHITEPTEGLRKTWFENKMSQ